ncbi:hypothetical protein MSG28_007717 [Choristoneura fumiferana]|uniref:Uncharacterized protein n=1 Tax=Choristoneura fumiferana TaxID=7141 RepID=A0ACC0JYJ4_CHOFU|nr:hypothetical protein MSG28_007717 [Choristoneura fumiferana]
MNLWSTWKSEMQPTKSLFFTWKLLGIEAGARRDALSAALAAAVALHAAAAALGHTALNVRVRDNLTRDSDGSARSLDLASSHSSDDDETSTRRSSHPPSATRDRTPSNNGGSYLPNITEGAPLGISPRWPSHIREESNRPEIGRWSQETGSDTEGNPHLASPSPNPLPVPDLTSDVYQMSRRRMKPSILENVHDTYVANTNVYGSRDFRDSGVTTREHDGYPPRDFRDSGIATMLKNDYQRKMDYGEYNDRMSEGSDKHHPHDKYLFPYTAEEDHSSLRPPQPPPVRNDLAHPGEGQQPMGAPLASMGETSEKSTTEDDAETRV